MNSQKSTRYVSSCRLMWMQDFKKIVEDLLQELMKELGVSDEQFVEACKKAESSGNPIHKKIVDQILAVENFLAFKRLMVKRNQELNKQALALYEKQQAAAKAGVKLEATEAPQSKEAKAK